MIKNWIKVTVVLAMCLTACSDESELSNGELPAEQAKESLDQLSGQMQDDVVDMVSSNGIDALLDLIAFIEISDPFNGRAINDSKAVVNQLASGIQNVAKSFNTKSKFAPNANEEEFSLSDYFGVYEWDTTSEMFVKTDEVVEYVELRFPVNESQATNNGAFRIIKLEEQHFVEEYITLPTAILAELYVDGNLSASLNFAANYSSIGFPENIAASLFLDPFTYDLAFSWDTSGQVSASLNVSKGSDQIFNVSISANIADQNTDNLQSLELSLSYRILKLPVPLMLHSMKT